MNIFTIEDLNNFNNLVLKDIILYIEELEKNNFEYYSRKQKDAYHDACKSIKYFINEKVKENG